MATIDVTGQRFGRLVAVERVYPNTPHATWMCICDCGSRTEVPGYALRRGSKKSCGCIKRDNPNRLTHGHSNARNRTYTCWNRMKQRCSNPNLKDYANYGGRGITVCDRWSDFSNFLADMGECPADMSIDRIDVNSNYEPSNCRWATKFEQANNTRRNRFITFKGETKTLAQWAREVGVTAGAISFRMGTLGWPVERALTSRKWPPRQRPA